MMNQEDIFKKIGQILNELSDQYQYLAQNPQELNELELELFLANASFLTDHVQIVRKLNKKTTPKALPEHAGIQEEIIEQEPVIPVKIVEEPIAHGFPAEEAYIKPVLEEEIFKLDKEPSTFEFILNEKPSSDRFEFEEKSVDEIFDRPLSKEEEQIIAQKQKLREMDSLESMLPEEDEIGPEPFLVSEPFTAPELPKEPEPVEEPAPVEEPQPVEEPGFSKTETPELETGTPEEQESEDYLFNKQEELGTVEEGPAVDKTPAPAEEVKPAEEIKSVTEAHNQEDLFTPPVWPAAEVPAEPLVKPSEPFAVPSTKGEEISSGGLPKTKPTLNDILSANSNIKSFGTGGGRIAVTDLKQAISLNDKMRYIKDLFNGYNLAYAEAIDLLNKMPDFKTADAFLQKNYAVKNNWASRQETAEQFYELLNQRFPAK
jgi:hypothetical protein